MMDAVCVGACLLVMLLITINEVETRRDLKRPRVEQDPPKPKDPYWK